MLYEDVLRDVVISTKSTIEQMSNDDNNNAFFMKKVDSF